MIDRWTTRTLEAPARIVREAPHAVVQFVRSWFDGAPTVRRAEPPRRAPMPPPSAPVTWTCSQTPNGVDCVARSTTTRRAARPAPRL